jgi:hypothetical protein
MWNLYIITPIHKHIYILSRTTSYISDSQNYDAARGAKSFGPNVDDRESGAFGNCKSFIRGNYLQLSVMGVDGSGGEGSESAESCENLQTKFGPWIFFLGIAGMILGTSGISWCWIRVETLSLACSIPLFLFSGIAFDGGLILTFVYSGIW